MISSSIEARETLDKAFNDTKEWISTIEQPMLFASAGHSSRSNQKERWNRPQYGWIKCNYDASHHEGNQDFRFGWITRNFNGTFLDCELWKFRGRYSIEEAEMSGLLWAMQSIFLFGYRKVVFEGDNQIINGIIKDNTRNLRLQHYIDTVHGYIRMFHAVSFKF